MTFNLADLWMRFKRSLNLNLYTSILIYVHVLILWFSKGAFTSKSEGLRPPKLPMASHGTPALHLSLSLTSTLSVPAVGCHRHLKTTRLNLEKSLSFALKFIVTKFWPHIHSIKGYLLNPSGSFPSVYPMTCIVVHTIVTSQMDRCPVLPINSLIAL